jgi:hypothetical protein
MEASWWLPAALAAARMVSGSPAGDRTELLSTGGAARNCDARWGGLGCGKEASKPEGNCPRRNPEVGDPGKRTGRELSLQETGGRSGE